MIRSFIFSAFVAALAASSPSALAGDGHDHSAHAHHGVAEANAKPVDADAAAVASQLPSYPLTSCVVSGEELGSMGDPIDFFHEGRLVRFCCSMCEGQFTKDPASYFETIDAAVADAQRESYALTTCPISGMKLGGMGDPYDHVYGTRLVRFCCGGCVPKFEEDPAAAMAKVDAALIEAQRDDYPLATCPLMDDLALDAIGEPYEFLYGTRLVRLCCEACEEKFWTDPAAHIAAVYAPPEDGAQ